MKAVIFRGVGDIALETVPDPRIEQPGDAIVRLTASAICGTDLHFVRGTMPGMKPGTILGHEGVGVVEEVGPMVRNFKRGDRVVIPSTIGCGTCVYCRDGYYSQCDRANPKGPAAGTAFYGGPESTGPFPGLQAEYARVPFAHTNLVKLPREVSDNQAILLSDIFPTGYFGAKLAEITDGDVLAVFGCGPVGQFAIASAFLLGAARVIAIDSYADRLAMARDQGAEVIDFNADDPVETVKELTEGIGVDRVIDAVGVDAEPPSKGPAVARAKKERSRFAKELAEVAPAKNPDGDLWKPGQAPTQVLEWAVEVVAKAGTVSVIGVYPPSVRWFPFGKALGKNLTIQGGNCNHRRYIPDLVEMVQARHVDPEQVLTQHEPLMNAIDAYKAFDQRKPGWIKVALEGEPQGETSSPRFAVEENVRIR